MDQPQVGQLVPLAKLTREECRLSAPLLPCSGEVGKFCQTKRVPVISSLGNLSSQPWKGSQASSGKCQQVVVRGLGEVKESPDWGLCPACTSRFFQCVSQDCWGLGLPIAYKALLSTRHPTAGWYRCLDWHPGIHRPSRAAHIPRCPGDRTEPTG